MYRLVHHHAVRAGRHRVRGLGGCLLRGVPDPGEHHGIASRGDRRPYRSRLLRRIQRVELAGVAVRRHHVDAGAYLPVHQSGVPVEIHRSALIERGHIDGDHRFAGRPDLRYRHRPS